MLVAVASFDLKPVLYMNMHINGYLTSVEIEQKVQPTPLFVIESGRVIPYPSQNCTRDLTENKVLEKKLRTIIQTKFPKAQEFNRMLNYIKSLKKGKNLAQLKSNLEQNLLNDKETLSEGKVIVNFGQSPRKPIEVEAILMKDTLEPINSPRFGEEQAESSKEQKPPSKQEPQRKPVKSCCSLI